MIKLLRITFSMITASVIRVTFLILIAAGIGFLLHESMQEEERDEIILKNTEAYLVAGEKYKDLLDYIWFKESSCGKNKACLTPNKVGAVGEYQIRPIFVADVARISKGKFSLNPMDNISCREGIAIWLDHYSSRIDNWDSMSIETQYQMYFRGYKGFKEFLK